MSSFFPHVVTICVFIQSVLSQEYGTCVCIHTSTVFLCGKIVFIGLSKGKKSINPEQFLHKQAILIGSKVMPGNLYWEMTRFLIDKKIRFESLVTHSNSLVDGPAAFKKFNEGAAGKFMFIMD